MTMVLVASFAAVVGLNDGSPMVAHTLAAGGRHPWWRIAALAVSLGLLPAVIGTGVAHTYAAGIVDLPKGSAGTAVAIAAVGAATLVVFVLHRWHRPTSLTLALVGALAGAAAGSGIDVRWRGVGRVLSLGAVAPVLALGLGFAVSRLLAVLNHRASARRVLGTSDGLAFSVQTVAYSLNDGQKVLLIPVVMAGANLVSGPQTVLAVTAGFAAGTLAGLRRARRSATVQVVPAHGRHLVAAELASAAVGLGGAALGTPLSMGQACAGANVGSGVADGAARVRWSVARSLAGAWLITLPSAALAGAAVVALLHLAP